MNGLDRGAVLFGAGYALCWVVPAGIANAVAVARDASGIAFLAFLAIIVGFAFGGYATARDVVDRPLQNAAASAALAFVAAQTLGIVVRLARGESVSPAGIVLTGLLSASAGVLGGLLAIRGARPSSRR